MITGTPTTLRSSRRQQYDALKELKQVVYDALTSRTLSKKISRDDARTLFDRYEDAVGTLAMMADLSEVEL
jgi:hypothetical protein